VIAPAAISASPVGEAFAQPTDSPHYHHLNVVVESNQAFRDHVVLRTHLRTNAGDRERYAARKRELATC
jgi:GrpB-like predicted nucleotidyltransferase (UPF0157 family)